MIEACVIDASVGIKVFLDEPDSSAAEQLFASLADDSAAQLYVPDLFFTECANILWKYVRRFGYPVEDAHANLTDLRESELTVISTTELLHSALDIGLQHNMTVYDSCYVALAQTLAVPLISADQKLVQKAKAVIDSRFLADLEL